ncbi:MAG TPA: hypothetical protein VL327_07770 [Pyrinomonadaceae bacterium]|jgi:hypothetical protein|nr:hypothetical protein [Pyrinomonadaceae bacterium]
MLDLLSLPPERRVLLIGLMALFAIILFVILIQLSCNDLSPEEVESQIKASERLRDLDQYCSEIPKPQDFDLKFKTLGGNGVTTSITYWFRTGQRFAELSQFYRENLEPKGWRLTELQPEVMVPRPQEIVFENDSYQISIEHDSGKLANYAFYCAKLSK